MGKQIRNVVVLGANGAMGSGSGAVFAAAGIPTVFLARTKDKAEAGRARAEGGAVNLCRLFGISNGDSHMIEPTQHVIPQCNGWI